MARLSSDLATSALPARLNAATLCRLAAFVALGGAVGTTARAQLEGAFPPGPGMWPWTTFWINIVGSFLLGALVELLVLSGPDRGWRRTVRVGAGSGVLGGFTTYSTFVLEVDRLVRSGHVATGAAYGIASVAAGVLAALLGLGLASSAWRRRAGSASGPRP